MRSTEKRRAAKEEKEKEKEKFMKEEEEFKEMICDKDLIIQELKENVYNFEELSLENDKNSAILAKLYDAGFIDEEGELVIK